MKKPIKRMLILLLLIALLIGGYFTYSKVRSNDIKKQNSNIYETANVSRGELKVSVSSSGLVVPQSITNPNYNYLQFSLTVDEMDIVNLKKNQIVNIEINAFPDKVFKGKIKSIPNFGTTVNGVTTYSVIVIFDNEIKGLKSGMTGTSTITTDKKDNILYVPIDAINQNDNGDTYIIVPSTEKEQFVTTGIHNDDSIEIIEGLSEGDEVRLPTLLHKETKGFYPMIVK
ncbi:MAG: efflux RND transporter periplasmic adaptor subunit [Clostridium sp.]|uniref:efflux RND transporter periplasmic adaptor subunit n=1 Tax=Clostridium sp. TaxID=1506 RepID=UPI003F2AF02C